MYTDSDYSPQIICPFEYVKTLAKLSDEVHSVSQFLVYVVMNNCGQNWTQVEPSRFLFHRLYDFGEILASVRL